MMFNVENPWPVIDAVLICINLIIIFVSLTIGIYEVWISVSSKMNAEDKVLQSLTGAVYIVLGFMFFIYGVEMLKIFTRVFFLIAAFSVVVAVVNIVRHIGRAR